MLEGGEDNWLDYLDTGEGLKNSYPQMWVLPHSWQLQVAGERGLLGLVLLSWPLHPVAAQCFHMVMLESPVRCSIPGHVKAAFPNWTVNSVPLLLHTFHLSQINTSSSLSHLQIIQTCCYFYHLKKTFSWPYFQTSPSLLLLFFGCKTPWKSSLSSIFNSLLTFTFH